MKLSTFPLQLQSAASIPVHKHPTMPVTSEDCWIGMNPLYRPRSLKVISALSSRRYPALDRAKSDQRLQLFIPPVCLAPHPTLAPKLATVCSNLICKVTYNLSNQSTVQHSYFPPLLQATYFLHLPSKHCQRFTLTSPRPGQTVNTRTNRSTYATIRPSLP